LFRARGHHWVSPCYSIPLAWQTLDRRLPRGANSRIQAAATMSVSQPLHLGHFTVAAPCRWPALGGLLPWGSTKGPSRTRRGAPLRSAPAPHQPCHQHGGRNPLPPTPQWRKHRAAPAADDHPKGRGIRGAAREGRASARTSLTQSWGNTKRDGVPPFPSRPALRSVKSLERVRSFGLPTADT
jgi:hypothetical protein